jgi:hypothetical protein
MIDHGYQVQGTIEMVKPDASANWTGMELVPFETIAERFLDIEHEGHPRTLTIAFGKPFVVDGRGWACPYRIAAPGREHITLAGGADSVHAIQMALCMVRKELSETAHHKKISFLGTDDFGFERADGSEALIAKCPGMPAC